MEAMRGAKQTFKTLEQRIRLLLQQQMTFINALERTRENALDRIKPVRTLAQVRNYLESHCNNTIDQRILSLFLDTCADLAEFCTKLESMPNCSQSAKEVIEQTLTLLSPTNDLTNLRAKYPHDVVNHLSCDDARNFYGGVVSIIPIAQDNIREALLRMEKAKPLLESYESTDRLAAIQKNRQKERKAGTQGVAQNMGVQTTISQGNSSAHSIRRRKGYAESIKPGWRPAGRFYTT